MKYIATTYSILIALLLFPLLSLSQQDGYGKKVVLTAEDSIYSSKLPDFKIPENRKSMELPTDLDNSQLPFFRPPFNQGPFWNCGQAASIGYNFTYEINAAKGADGSLPENQYSPNFTFNFLNGGYGWGVNYMNSFEVLKACGNPNLADYGELYNEDLIGWKSGYELYENAMKNRVTGVYKIDVSNPEGVNMLKHWLLDHGNGSQYGGVSNIYVTTYFAGILPDDSPDAGLPVYYTCGEEPAGHALTIVGFNDSIRFDINYDGQYTNHIDITGDGIVDMKDWEWGGFRTQNSHLNYDGKAYMMYRTLALEYGDGGIWNQQTHLVTVDADFEPISNIRLKLNYNSRDKIKIIAGVSPNLQDNYPRYTMDFPIFNFQGGEHYMQGLDSIESEKEMELALDISPLYSHLEDGEAAKFFIQIAENDNKNYGNGYIEYFSLVTSDNEEIVCNEVPVNIVDNALTTLQLIHNPHFNKVSLSEEEPQQILPGTLQHFQPGVSGGYPPYNWNIRNNYTLNPIPGEFEEINQTPLFFDNNTLGHVMVDLPFGFPFYGDTIREMAVYLDGFIMFDDLSFPYPYYVGEESMIKNYRVIAPFMSDLLLEFAKSDGVWTDINNHRAIIRWKTSCETSWAYNDVNFDLILYPDGRIETHYGDMTYADHIQWVSGVSNGDKTNYTINNKNQRHEALSNSGFLYKNITQHPNLLNIDNDGNLSILISDPLKNYPVEIQVTDSKGVIDSKVYNFSASDMIVSYEVNDNSSYVNYNEVSSVHAVVTNRSGANYENVQLIFRSRDPLVKLNDTIVDIGNVPAGETIRFENIATFSLLPMVIDRYNISIDCEMKTASGSQTSVIDLIVNAPKINLLSTNIIDNNNQLLYPGETATIKLLLQNTGHARSTDLSSVLNTENDDIYIKFEQHDIDQMQSGDTLSVTYTIAASWAVPIGDIITIGLDIYDVNNNICDRLGTSIRVGHIPVLIIDINPGMESGLEMQSIFNEIGLNNTLSSSINVNFNDHLCAFYCMGGMFSLYTITETESNILVDYLNSGGKLYFESGADWHNSEGLEIFDKFGIQADAPGYFYPLDTITGTSNNFTNGLSLTIEDQNPYINYFLHSTQPGAFPFMKSNAHDTAIVAVANEAENYKTIGSNILFKTLTDIDNENSTKEYLIRILDFFEIGKYIYASSEETIENKSSLNIVTFPNPSSGNATIKINNDFNAETSIQVYNMLGEEVYNRLIMETLIDKSFSYSWDCESENGTKLLPGIYIIRCSSNGAICTNKLIIR